MKSVTYLIALLLLAAPISAVADPYRTTRIVGGGTDRVIPVPSGKAIEIVNFVCTGTARIYVGPDANSQAAPGTVLVLTADTNAQGVVTKSVIITPKDDLNATPPTFIIVAVANGQTAFLTYKILAN